METKRILIVDDDRSVVKVLELVLHREGFEIATAFDGEEALRQVSAYKPDLVLLDIEMPKVDGYEVCRQIRQSPELKNIRIVILTVRGQATGIDAQSPTNKDRDQQTREQAEGFNAGADAFMSKPVVAKEVVTKIRRLLKMPTKRILVVDDNCSIVKTLELVLTHAGFDVLTAFDGEEGLRKALSEKPDLVLLDIEMPKLNGYEVCRRIRKAPELKNIRIIMLTVKGQVANLESEIKMKRIIEQRVHEQTEGFEAGADEFLSKPIVAKEVLKQIQHVLSLVKM